MPSKITAYSLVEPFGPTNATPHRTDAEALDRVIWQNRHGYQAVALFGEHSYDELKAALRRERKSYVARLAASVSA